MVHKLLVHGHCSDCALSTLLSITSEVHELGQDNILLIGGRGKWVSNSVEVFDSRARQWLMAGLGSGLGGHDKRYTACLATRPNDRWGMTLTDK